jgi:hypothetical protein
MDPFLLVNENNLVLDILLSLKVRVVVKPFKNKNKAGKMSRNGK